MISSTKVWQYYLKIPPYQAQCYLCSKIIRTGGGTTNVRNHLKSKHKEYIEENKEFDRSAQVSQVEVAEEVTESDDMIQEIFEIEPESFANLASPLPTLRRIRSPVTPAKRSRSKSHDSGRINSKIVPKSDQTNDFHRASRITSALAFMISKDGTPTSIVERKGFRHFVKTAAPSYELPSKNMISGEINAQYDAMTFKIKKKLKNVEYSSLSLLVYPILDRIFLIISIHFINPTTKKFDTIFLGIRHLSKTFAVEQLAIEIESTLANFKLMKSKIVSVCTDGSPEITMAVKRQFGEDKHVQCLKTVLNSVLRDGLADPLNPGLRKLITDVDNIIADSGHGNVFIASQTEQLVRKLSKQGVDATHRFILTLPVIVEALFNFVHERTTLDLQLLAEINKILALFDVATEEISANEQVTGSSILPMISCIKSALHNLNLLHEVAKTVRKKLLLSLGTRTKTHNTQPLLGKATLCDPRFKKVYLSPLNVEQVINSCCNEVKEHLRALPRSTRSAKEKASINGDNPLWLKHDKRIAKGGFYSDVEVDTSIVSEDELKLYLGQELLPRNADPVKFWTQSQGCMPSLSHVALKNLTILGCKVTVDAFISSFERLLSSKKFQLTDHQLMERMFLNCVNDNAI